MPDGHPKVLLSQAQEGSEHAQRRREHELSEGLPAGADPPSDLIDLTELSDIGLDETSGSTFDRRRLGRHLRLLARPVVFGLDSLWSCLLPPGLQALTPDGGGRHPSPSSHPHRIESLMSSKTAVFTIILIALFGILFSTSSVTLPPDSESLISNRTAVVALILIALFGVLSFVFLGNSVFYIGAVVAALFVAIARITRIRAPRS